MGLGHPVSKMRHVVPKIPCIKDEAYRVLGTLWVPKTLYAASLIHGALSCTSLCGILHFGLIQCAANYTLVMPKCCEVLGV